MKKLLSGVLAALLAVSAGIPVAAKNNEVHFTKVNGNIYISNGDDYEKINQNEMPPDRSIYIKLEYSGANLQVDAGEAGSAGLFPADTGGTAVLGWEKPLITALFDKDLFKFKASKGDDDKKIIKSMSLAEKDVDGDGVRDYCIRIDLNDDFTDKEFKITPEFTFTAKKNMKWDGARLETVNSSADAQNGIWYGIVSGTRYILPADALSGSVGGSGGGVGESLTGAIYISNETVKDSDGDWTAGQGGFVSKPEKNEDNTVTWSDENKEIAKLEFYADSSTTKYFPKLSTKWNDENYEAIFQDQDAYLYNFVGNPQISSTSRPKLTIYNPYVKDGESTVDVQDIAIYEVNEGELIDATAAFVHMTNDDGDDVFVLETRKLGAYIFAQKPVAQPAPEAPEVPEAPAQDKPIPNTGR